VTAREDQDIGSVHTRQEFAQRLTVARERAGLTVRDVARASGIPASTAGGYFSGRNLPSAKPDSLLTDILRACGVTGRAEIAEWHETLRRVRRAPGPKPAAAPVPYRGLEAFQVEHARWFHGRDRLIQALADLTTAQCPDGHPVLVVGPSGAGKSSVLRAGLIPTLCGDSVREPILFTPGVRPMTEWRNRMEKTGDHVLIVVDQFEEVFTICPDHDERTEFVAALVAAVKKAPVVLGMRADFYGQASKYPDLAPALENTQIVVRPMDREELRRAIVEPARTAGVRVEDGLVELLLRELEPGAHGSPDGHDVGVLPLLSHALLTTWKRARGRLMTVADYTATGGIRGAIAATAETVFDGLDDRQRNIARRLFQRLVQVGEHAVDIRRHVSYAEIFPEGRNEEAAAVNEILDLFVEQRLITADADSVHLTHEALLATWPRLGDWIDADRAGLRTYSQLVRDARVWHEAGCDPGVLYRGSRLAVAREWAAEPGHHEDLNALERRFLDDALTHEDAERQARRRRVKLLRWLVVVLAVLLVVAAVLTVVVFRQRTDALVERDRAISQRLASVAVDMRAQDVSLAMQLALAAYEISPTPQARSGLLDATSLLNTARILGPEGESQSVAVRRDGQVMAAASGDQTVRLWRIGGRPRTVPLGVPLTGPAGTIFSVVFSPDEKPLAEGGGDKLVRLWDITDPARPIPLGSPLSGAANTIYSVAFSPDSRVLAAGSADNTVHLWDLSDPGHPVVLPALTGFTGYVHSVAFSPDGAVLAAGSADTTVRLWDMRTTARPIPLGPPLTGPARAVYSVAFGPDGHTLAAGSGDKAIYVWDVSRPDAPVRSGDPLTGAASWINSLAFASDGRTLAAGSSDNTVWLWDLTTRTAERTLPHPAPVTSVAYAGNALVTGAADSTIRLWDLHGPVVTDSTDMVFTTRFSGSIMITGTGPADGAFRLWDVTGPQHPRLIGRPNMNPLPPNRFGGTLAVSGDGHTLAAGGADGQVQLWDITDSSHPAPRGVPLSGLSTPVKSLDFSSDGRLLAASGAENTVWLWDLSDTAHPHPVTGPTNYVYSVAFSPDSHTLAAGSADKKVWLWDVTSPAKLAPLATLTGPVNYVSSVIFSPDGHTLAVGSADKTVRLWDITDRAHPRALGSPLTGPRNYVYSVAFSPDGRTLAAGSADKSIWLWDVSDPSRPGPPSTLSAPAGAVRSVTFSLGGHILAGAGDRTVRLWITDPDMARDYVCATTGDTLTPAEWAQYVHDLPYRRICG
jgi:WD40 repeat protein/transcriptional regulator with XRE-family HTH domain